MESKTTPVRLDNKEYDELNSALMSAFDIAKKRLNSANNEVRGNALIALPHIVDTIMRLRDRAPR